MRRSKKMDFHNGFHSAQIRQVTCEPSWCTARFLVCAQSSAPRGVLIATSSSDRPQSSKQPSGFILAVGLAQEPPGYTGAALAPSDPEADARGRMDPARLSREVARVRHRVRHPPGASVQRPARVEGDRDGVVGDQRARPRHPHRVEDRDRREDARRLRRAEPGPGHGGGAPRAGEAGNHHQLPTRRCHRGGVSATPPATLASPPPPARRLSPAATPPPPAPRPPRRR